MAQVATRRFLSHVGGRSKFYEVGDQVPDDVAQATDPALWRADGEPGAAAPSGVDGGEGRTLSADSLAEFEGLKTIDQIMGWVSGAGSDEARELRARHALAVEQEGGKRKGLVDALEAILAGPGGGGDQG